MKTRSHAPFLLLIMLAFFGSHSSLHGSVSAHNDRYIVAYQYTGKALNLHNDFAKSKTPASNIYKIRTKALNDFSAFNVPVIWTSQDETYVFPIKYYSLYRLHLNGLRCDNYSLRGPPAIMLA